MQNFRTDLALERRDLYKKANNIEDEVDGIETEEEKVDEDIKITRVKVLNENGENAIGKKVGNYITIDINNLKIAGEEQIQKASEALTKELRGKPNRDNLAEEISDVMMMLEVTTRCLDVSLDDIEKWSVKKQQALRDWYFVQGKGEKYEDSEENER